MNKIRKLANLKGILADIDGTLYYKGELIPKAIKTVEFLRKKGLNIFFLTNTDSKSPKTVFKILQNYGFNLKDDEIFTPIIALKEFLSRFRDKKIFLVTTKEVEEEFKGFSTVQGSEIPDFVVLGDFHDNWDVNRLNMAFKYVLKGAQLLGTQGNKYYLDSNGEPVIDTGSFIHMIGYATNTTPKIFGKPSKEYFLQALKIMSASQDEVIVIGDDFESDIQGAINANIKAILVKTGKGQYFDLTKAHIKPYMILDSFSSLMNFF